MPITMSAVPFVLRDYRPEDFDPLWRLDQECFPPGIAYSRHELKSYLGHAGSFTLVAEALVVGRPIAEKPIADDAGTAHIAGFIVAHPGPTGHIITIDVRTSARRSGLGSLLLTAAEERLQASGSHAVGLETAVDNLPALSFYKRHGYSVIRTRPRYYSNGVDALVLKKAFTPK
jgi:ribosomal-protein-alanine N-acetyltransferase